MEDSKAQADQKATHGVRPISDLPPTLLKDIHDKGLWFCSCLGVQEVNGVERIVPKCFYPPVVEVRRMVPGAGDKPIRSLFCERHGREWCEDMDVKYPESASHNVG
jgi:hypothetical protein